MIPEITNLQQGDLVWVAYADTEKNCILERTVVQQAYQTENGTYVADLFPRRSGQRVQLVQVEPYDQIHSLAAVQEHDGPNDRDVIDDETDYSPGPVFAVEHNASSIHWPILLRVQRLGSPEKYGLDMMALKMGLYPGDDYAEHRWSSEAALISKVDVMLDHMIEDVSEHHRKHPYPSALD